MTLLDNYVKQVRESRGLLHQRYLAALRNYLNTTPEDAIIREIYQLEYLEDIRTLWEAGLNSAEQHHALIAYDQIVEGSR